MPLLIKILKYVLICLVVIVASVVGYIYLPGLLTLHSLNPLITKQQAAKVTGTVAYDLTDCNSKYPMLVKITNGSSRVVTSVSFYIKGYREGYSFPLYNNPVVHSSDKIISSGYISSTCWSLSQPYLTSLEGILPKNLIWKIENIDPQFDPEFQNL